jgi:hypothetical protein
MREMSAGGPSGTWWFVDNYRHSNSSNFWGTQFAYGWEDNANRLLQRNITGGSFSGWVEYWSTANFNPSSYQTVSGAITTSNIGSQSVNYASSSGNADTVDSQNFSYSNNSNSPTYLWATDSNGSSYLAARGSISVNYANSAGSASSAGNADTVDGFHATTESTGSTVVARDSGAGITVSSITVGASANKALIRYNINNAPILDLVQHSGTIPVVTQGNTASTQFKIGRRTASVSGDTRVTITYSSAFPSGLLYGVVVTSVGTANMGLTGAVYGFGVESVGSSSFVFVNDGTAASAANGFTWIAFAF